MEKYVDVLKHPIGVPFHCQVQHDIDLVPIVLLPNGPLYCICLLEIEEIE
jgi:hypothetical protein